MTSYPHPCTPTPHLNHPHKDNMTMFKSDTKQHQHRPWKLSEMQCLGPTSDLLGDSDVPKNHYYTLFHTILFSIDFFLHHHAHHCLDIAYSIHTESAQASSLTARSPSWYISTHPPTLHPNASVNIIIMALTTLLLQQFIIVSLLRLWLSVKISVIYVMDIKWVPIINQALF